MLEAGLIEHEGDLANDRSEVIVELLHLLCILKFIAGEGITAQKLESLKECIFLPFD